MSEEYLDAKRLGDWSYRRSIVFGKYPYLPALDDMVRPEEIQGENRLGIVEIPMEDIVGTKTAGRQQAFADNFMPIMATRSEFAMKWQHLYDSAMTEGIRDPILVYEYMHKFYVQEGNKRVSVMKYNQAVSIPADVIRVMPVRTEEKGNRLYYEFVRFFKDAGLYSLKFSELGAYEKLTKLVGMEPGKPWDEDTKRNVHAGFMRFRELYEARGGEKLSVTPADAFLLYLDVYGLEGILSLSTDAIQANLDRVWKEYLKSAGEVTLVQTPKEVEKPSSGGLFFLPEGEEKKRQLRIAFLYEHDIQRSSWAYGHELGRNYLIEKYGDHIHTWKYENCATEKDFEAAIRDAAEKKADLVFTTTGIMLGASVKAAVTYPKLQILNCSVHTSYNSIRTYYSRMYEAKFLMGALAASVTEGNDIGYVELCPMYGTLANINAFALGAQLVNPWSRVHLRWGGRKGEDWRQYFLEKEITTISGQEFVRPANPSREYGLYMVSEGEVISNLAAPVFDWGRYYELLLHSFWEGSFQGNQLAKSHQALNYWYGLREGVIDIILSGDLHYSSRKLVDLLRREIVMERMSPFQGEIHSQDGIVQGDNDGKLSAESIVNMRWLNDNVVGSVPALSEFTEPIQELIRIGGFLL